MLNRTEKEDLPEMVDCPHCGREIKTLVVVNNGFIKGRPHSSGGPYYQSKCMHCREEFNCFFEREVFTRKPGIKKAFIFPLWRSILALFSKTAPDRAGLTISTKKSATRVSQEGIVENEKSVAEPESSLPIIFKVHPELLTAFRVLGLDPTSSVSCIKKRFKMLVKGLHPDRTGHKTSREREEATKKLIEINRAYGTIKELFM